MPPEPPGGTVEVLEQFLLRRMAATRARPFIVGLCGAQGSGKSTAAAALRARLSERGLATTVLSIDDLYLGRQAREALARDVHPLLLTRGVPGTHDVALGGTLLSQLGQPGPVALPRFDKANDSGLPKEQWAEEHGPADIVILEGWMVGARPQPDEALIEPANELERQEDAGGAWRRWVNGQLAGPYQALFARLHALILLAAPSFDIVLDWRREQEEGLRRTVTAQGAQAHGLMDEAALRRFIAHYQRLTEHILREMPGRADLVVQLDPSRRVVAISER